MRRLLSSILIATTALLLIALLTVQIILWTDLPRSLVCSIARDRTGLIVEMGALETGWSGSTSIRNLSVRLPLEDEPLLAAPAASIEHTALIPLLLTRRLEFTRITVTEPEVAIRQERQGPWNLQRALAIVRAKQPPTKESQGMEQLPHVDIDGMTVLIERGSESIRYEPITVSGEPVANSVWRVDAALSDIFDVHGSIVPGARVHQDVAFDIDVQRLLRPWMNAPPTAAITGRWTGDIHAGRATGRLSLSNAEIRNVRLAGNARIESGEGRLSIQPIDLAVDPATASGETFELIAGEIALNSSGVTVDRVQLVGRETSVRAQGEWNRQREAAELTLVWTGAAPGGFEHDGRVDVSALFPDIGPTEIELRVDASARGDERRLRASMVASAHGRSFKQFTSQIRFPVLRWIDDEREADLSRIALGFNMSWPTVSLVDVTLPRADRVVASGRADLDELGWSIDFDAAEWALPGLGDQPVDVLMSARGDERRLDFSVLRIRNEQFEIDAKGSFLPHEAVPLQADASVTATMPPTNAPDAGGDEQTGTPTSRVHAELDVNGSIVPLDIAYQGEVTADHVHVVNGDIEQVSMPWAGHVGARQATFSTDTFDMLGGQWTLAGQYSLADRDLSPRLNGDQTPLSRIVSLLGLPIEGDGVLNLGVRVSMPELDPNGIDLRGDWSVRDLRGPALKARKGEGRFRVDGRDITLSDIRLEHDEADVTGAVRFNLDRRNLIWMDLKSRDWPVSLAGVDLTLLINADARVRIDTGSLTADGELRARTDLHLRDQAIGTFTMDSAIRGRTIEIASLTGTLLGGSVDGDVTIPFDEWTTARGEVSWQDIQPSKLGSILPTISKAEGSASGSLVIRPTTRRDDTKALALELDNNFADGRLGELTIGDLTALVHVTPTHAVLEQGRLTIADGHFQLWGRTNQHDDDRYGHIFVTIESLDLNQLIDVAAPDLGLEAGRLNGRLTVGGYLHDPHRLFGSADLELSSSDLASVPLFAFLYDGLRLNLGPTDPTGEGTIELKLEGDTLRVDSFRYFNRGTDVVLRFAVRDIFAGTGSQVDGLAIGAVLPFRDLDLPLAGDLDRLVQALQANAISVRIDGTLGEVEYRVVPFEELGLSLERILRGTTEE
jgi:hypothetical protein